MHRFIICEKKTGKVIHCHFDASDSVAEVKQLLQNGQLISDCDPKLLEVRLDQVPSSRAKAEYGAMIESDEPQMELLKIKKTKFSSTRRRKKK